MREEPVTTSDSADISRRRIPQRVDMRAPMRARVRARMLSHDSQAQCSDSGATAVRYPRAVDLRLQRLTTGISLATAAGYLGITVVRLSRLERGIVHSADLANTYQDWLNTQPSPPA